LAGLEQAVEHLEARRFRDWWFTVAAEPSDTADAWSCVLRFFGTDPTDAPEIADLPVAEFRVRVRAQARDEAVRVCLPIAFDYIADGKVSVEGGAGR
jgi:hypothetical protein